MDRDRVAVFCSDNEVIDLTITDEEDNHVETDSVAAMATPTGGKPQSSKRTTRVTPEKTRASTLITHANVASASVSKLRSKRPIENTTIPMIRRNYSKRKRQHDNETGDTISPTKLTNKLQTSNAKRILDFEDPDIEKEEQKEKRKNRRHYVETCLKNGHTAFIARQSSTEAPPLSTKNELNWCILKVLSEQPGGILRSALNNLVKEHCGVHIVVSVPMGGAKFVGCRMDELEKHDLVKRDRTRKGNDMHHNRFMITKEGRDAMDLVSGILKPSSTTCKITDFFKPKIEEK